MSKREQHDRYEELSIFAWPGEDCTRELDGLKQHLDTCGECSDHYGQFNRVVLPQLSASNDWEADHSEDIPEIDYDAIRSRLFKRAQAAGMVFSAQTLPTSSIREEKRAGILTHRGFRVAAAASVLLGVTLCGYYAGSLRRGGIGIARVSRADGPGPLPIPRAAIAKPSADGSARPGSLADDNRQIVFLEEELREAETQRDNEQARAAKLASARSALEEQLKAAGQQDHAAQETMAALRTQIDQSQEKASSDEASFIADETRIKELEGKINDEAAALDNELQTASANHEVSSLMAARNLHIIDVSDTDGDGKTKPIFGRIFFAEDKQLLFYAYDLDESRLANAKYNYRIWGEKQGAGQSPQALGVFYADNKSDKRWVFDYDDPKVLREIDTVFVTLEPSNKKVSHPRGQQLMYAYLRSPANHP